jgi:drug/metabolite transporter (DMT)-like permease
VDDVQRRPGWSSAQVNSSRKTGVAAVALSVAILSIGSTLVRESGLPGPVTAFWRLLFGSVLWHLIVFVTGRRSGGPTRLTNEAWKLTLLPGIGFGINLSFFFTAITKTSIAHAEFIGALTPLIILPFASRKLREKIQPAILALALTAFAGIALILFAGTKKTSSPPTRLGDLLGIGAICTWAYYLLKSRSVRQRISVSQFMAGMTSVATVVIIPVAIWRAGSVANVADLTPKGLLMISIITITSGIVSHGFIAWAQKSVPISTISIMQVAQPGIATFWAWLILHQGVAPIQVVGMLVVMVAIGGVAWLSSKSTGELPKHH